MVGYFAKLSTFGDMTKSAVVETGAYFQSVIPENVPPCRRCSKCREMEKLVREVVGEAGVSEVRNKKASCIHCSTVVFKKSEESTMEGLGEKISRMDFIFLGSGQHGMSVEGMRKNLGNEHVVFLDVRTNEEVSHVSFPFAKHIPLNELPGRINEVPKGKLIVAFCASVFRGAIAYTYLLSQGFEEVKALTASIEDMLKLFKPGALYKS